MDKIKLLIAVILAILPIISFFLQYNFSKKENCLKAIKKHVTVFYSDWIFVIFNILFVYSVSFTSIGGLILILIFSAIANIAMHIYWSRLPIEEDGSHMYNSKTRKLLNAGKVHFLFSTIETALILTFLFSPTINKFYLYESAILGLYFLSYIPSSLKIHNGRLLISDLITCILGILAILIKLLI